jgi:S-adenosylmethionine/arginine decarboxylase-like enzyme
MVAYGEPHIIKFGSGDKEGITLIQLIETSNITCHFVDYNGSSFWDVFSCKPFDQQIVVDLIREYFKPKAIQSDFKTREAPSCP